VLSLDPLYFLLRVLIVRFPRRVPRDQDDGFPIPDFVIEERSMWPYNFVWRFVMVTLIVIFRENAE
jgi:hypothetical protein